MTIVLSILLLIALGFLVQQWRYRRRIVKTSTRLIGNLHYNNNQLANALAQAEKNYEALEVGQEEIIDNYENDFLSFKDQIAAAQNSAAYDRECREEVEKKLAMTNAVIDYHAGHCETILKDLVDGMMEEIQPKSE